MSFVSKITTAAVAATLVSASMAGGPAPMVNNHDGMGVSAGLYALPSNTIGMLGLVYTQSAFRAEFDLGAAGAKPTTGDKQWLIPIHAYLAFRHGMTDNLYANIGVAGTYTFITNKSGGNNAYSVGLNMGLDYYLSDSLFVSAQLSPFMYSGNLSTLTQGELDSGYNIFTTGSVGLTYSFNL